MTTFNLTILIAHTLVALVIIALVLLQRGKGADAGAAFGSGASGTVFGARGSSNFFSRATAVLATVFFVSSLGLAYLSSQRAETTNSVLENAAPLSEEPESVTTEPAEPADELPELGAPAGPAPDEAADGLPALESPSEGEPQEPPQ